MDEAAYAEFEATLLESFPQEMIEIDGVEYSFFVLELEVRTGDGVRYERYGFRREGEEWIFTRLEIGALQNKQKCPDELCVVRASILPMRLLRRDSGGKM